MRKLTASVVACALALAFLTFAGTPARGTSFSTGPTVTATAQPLGIKLDWTYPEAAGAVGYIIRRSAVAGQEDRWPMTDFPVTATTWLDEDITPGETYYYIVVPVLKDGSLGFNSVEAEATAVGLLADRRLAHFHMDATEALIRTAAGDQSLTLTAQPLNDHGRVMMTLEDIAALTGADLTMNGDSKIITQKLSTGRMMTMEIGKACLLFGKAERTDTCAPLVRDGHVYLPVRWIVEAMDGELSFNPLDGSVTITVAR